MKHVSILVPEGDSNLSSIVGPYKVFTRANQCLKDWGRQPAFNVQLVGNSNEINLHSGLFIVRPQIHFKNIRKTDLIIIPAIDKSFSTSLKQNEIFLPWITNHHKRG